MLGLPSENDRVAFTSDGVIVGSFLRQIVLQLGSRERILVAAEKALDEQVVLEQPATAAPFQAADVGGRQGGSVHGWPCESLTPGRRQTARRTISSLILPMAFVGFRPFGQTSTQFMMVWQRNRRYGSSRLSRRSLVAWSRVSP